MSKPDETEVCISSLLLDTRMKPGGSSSKTGQHLYNDTVCSTVDPFPVSPFYALPLSLNTHHTTRGNNRGAIAKKQKFFLSLIALRLY